MRKSLILFLLLLISSSLRAQINQSVQVSNEYQARFADFPKAASNLTVPDSLHRFNYRFDYSVFDSPYKGAYEFEPYEVALTPQARKVQSSSFSLKAGAGFMPHPVLDFDWDPIQKDSTALRISNRAGGRIGVFAKSQAFEAFSGYDLTERLTLDFRKTLRRSVFSLGASYQGMFTSSPHTPSLFNSALISIRSNSTAPDAFGLKLNADYRLSSDRLSLLSASTNSHYLQLSGNLRPKAQGAVRFITDYQFEFEHLSDQRASIETEFNAHAGIAQRAVFSLGALGVDAGVRVDATRTGGSYRLGVFPLVKLGIGIPSLRMKVYAKASGGHKLNDYYSLKATQHFYYLDPSTSAPRKRVFDDHIHAIFGFSGFIAQGLNYDLHAGYRELSGLATDELPIAGYSSICFKDLKYAYLDFSAHWISERLSADAAFFYQKKFSGTKTIIAAPAFNGSISGQYNFLKRIYLGASLNFTAKRLALSDTIPLSDIPFWADLALNAEYKFSSKWSAWAKLGNLLCMQIERQLGFIERGPYISLGIGLNL